MGFKLPGKSIQSGTSAHSSALKMKAEADASALKKKAYGATKSWEAGQKTSKESKSGKGYNLDRWVKERSKHEKGSAEYNKYQNAINESLGSKVRHTKVTAKSKSEGTTTKPKMSKGREVGKSGTEYRPGIGVTEVKVKKHKGTGETTKSVREFTGVKGDKGKTVIKSDKTGDLKSIKRKKTPVEGDVRKEKEKYYRKGEEKGTIKKKVVKEGGRRTVTKTDREGNVTTKSRRTLKGILTGKGKKEKE
jgi:hypothetical protein